MSMGENTADSSSIMLEDSSLKNSQFHCNRDMSVSEVRPSSDCTVNNEDGISPLSCLVCKSSFGQTSHLFNHMLTHTNAIHPHCLPALVCPLCGFSCQLKNQLLKHMMSHLNDPDVNKEEILHNAVDMNDHLSSVKVKDNGSNEFTVYGDNDESAVSRDACSAIRGSPECDHRSSVQEDIRSSFVVFDKTRLRQEAVNDQQCNQNSGQKLSSLPFGCDKDSSLSFDKESVSRHDSSNSNKPLTLSSFSNQTKNSSPSSLIRDSKQSAAKRCICPFCKESFKTLSVYKKHVMSSHPGKKPFSCGQCHFMCMDSSGLKKHMMTHKDYRPFMCSVCDYRCRRAERLKEHMFIHEEIHPYQCEQCGYKTRRRSLLNSHKKFRCSQKSFDRQESLENSGEGDMSRGQQSLLLNTLSNNEGEREVSDELRDDDERIRETGLKKASSADWSSFDAQQQPFTEEHETGKDIKLEPKSAHESRIPLLTCLSNRDRGKDPCADRNIVQRDGENLQKASLRNVEEQKKPFALLYNRIKEECESIIKSTQRPGPGQGRKFLTCSLCSYITRKASHLKRHMLTHTTEKPITCDQCDYKCKSEHHLKRHMIRHSGVKPLSCTTCRFSCYEQGDLKSHLRIHSGFKAFHCSYCDYSARTQYHLNEHAVVHSDIKPFLCSECGKSFKRKSRLNQHLFEHSNEKSLSCSYCPYKCHRQCELNKHVLKHLSPEERAQRQQAMRMYLCPECGFSCSNGSNLRQHIRTHSDEKPFGCQICSFKCRTKGEVKKHSRKHQPSSSLSCEFCPFKCKHESSLKRHTLKHTCTDPFKCSMCSFTSVVRYYLKRHMRNKHNIDLKDYAKN